MKRLSCALMVAFSCSLAAAGQNLLVNGDFENGTQGWTNVWSREPGVKSQLDEQVRHGGKTAIRIEHNNAQDWSLAQEKRLNVKPGEVYELSGWLRTHGEGEVSLSTSRDQPGQELADHACQRRDCLSRR
jgi:hypothetical protein